MAQQLGRISGPLLVNNLLRAGQTSGEVNLAFETDLLYIDVINGFIGINTDSPSRDLQVNGTSHTTYLLSDNNLNVANIEFVNNQIQNVTNSISLIPDQLSDPIVKGIEFRTANLSVTNQLIENLINDSDININLNGLGELQFYTTVVNVNGNLHATGDITWDGSSIIIGNNDSDNVNFNSDLSSNLIPDISDEYDVGTLNKSWKTVYSNTVTVDSLTTNSTTINDIDLLLRQGNTIYVSVNGNDDLTSIGFNYVGIYSSITSYNVGDIVLDDGDYYRRILDSGTSGYPTTDLSRWVLTEINANDGTHPHSPFRTIKHALSVAQSGDEVVIFPGIYTEDFPLTVPQGVSVRGAGIRSVAIQPSATTNRSDAFLLNGDTTVSFLTVQNFYEGYAFKLSTNFETLYRSPYIYNVTVLTKGIPLDASVYMDGWYVVPGDPNSGVYGQSWRILALNGTLNGKNFYQYVDETLSWTGTEWEYYNNTVGVIATGVGDTDYPWQATWSGTITSNPYGGTYSISDPLGYNQGTAGGGAYIDGVVADPSMTTLPSCLFFSTTFIVPNADGLVATNSTRIEWLNSFTYYAKNGIKIFSGEGGLAGLGTTNVELAGVTGTVEIGDTFTYYSDDESTVIASGVVNEIDSNIYKLNGNVHNLILLSEINSPVFYTQGLAQLSTANYKFETASLYLEGTTSYFKTNDSYDFTFSNQPFCVESWIYTVGFPTTEVTIFSQWGSSPSEQSFKLTILPTGEVKVYLNDGANTSAESGLEYLLSEDGQILTDENGEPFISENSAIILNVWQHIALTRVGDTITVYISGVKKIQLTLSSGAIINNSTGSFNLGFSTGDTDYYYGYIDEVRVSKLTARYSSDFTPPSSPFTSDSSSALLLHFDGENGSTVIVDSAPPTQNLKFTNATATGIINLDYSDFGAELRSINSANVYGLNGAVADGFNTLAYLIGHNFGYIGCGADSNNDYGLVIQSNEVVAVNHGVIYYDSMDHKGDYRIGDIFYVNQQTGQISFDAQSINLSAQGNITFEGPNGITIIDATQVQTGNIRIFDNTIESLSGPVNVYSASTDTYLNTDVYITGNQDISGNVVIKGTLYLGDTPFDNITIIPKLDQTINPKLDQTYDLGHRDLDPKVWNTLFVTTLNVDDVVTVNSNTIQTITVDQDLELIAAGSGKIHVYDTDVEITENLTVNSALTVNGLTSIKDIEINGNILQTGDFNQTGNTDITGTFQTVNLEVLDTLSYLEVPDIKIVTNEIQATVTDDDLIITANNTGGVKFEQFLVITNNEFTNERIGALTDLQKSIVLSPNGTGNVVIDSTNSMTIPYANDTNRVLYQVGEIRQHNITTLYEGFISSTSNTSMFNLYDSDRNTYITAELTPGTNDNTLRFANNGTVYTTITDYALTNNVIHIDDIKITNNVISNLISTNDINIGVDSSITNNINNILVQENTITNQQNTALTLSSTDTGYYKFAGTAAIVIPTGGNDDRRLTPETGEIRINSDNDHEMEVFNGINWIPAVGPLSAASEEEVIEIMDTWALILG
jgi:hypothetical protein